jgi:hypothetical protein
VIKLKTRTGTVQARIFVTDDNRHIGVVIERNTKPIDAMGFDAPSLRRLKTECLQWLAHRKLDDESRLLMLCELKDNFETLESIRLHGEDITQGWLGSRASRTLPEIIPTV